MSDIAMRVGGPSTPAAAQANVLLRISAGNVIIDNGWLWRADHVEGGGLTRNGQLPCQVAAVVNGNDVTSYGLKAEHCLTDQVQWNGERGDVYFFQSELPYDVTQANFGDKGYVGYRVGAKVQEHKAHGIGVYHYFRDFPVTVASAISAPAHLEANFVSPLAVFLNGLGSMKHIINDKGDATGKDPAHPTDAVPRWMCAAPSVTQAGGSCKVGDAVTCPGTTVGCAGNACCPDGSTCPSAQEDFACCPSPKKADCVQPAASITV
jgi:hypothetical protein